MSLVFFDTSALVKRYHLEPRTEQVNQLIENNEVVIRTEDTESGYCLTGRLLPRLVRVRWFRGFEEEH